jgi:hypothetical protein
MEPKIRIWFLKNTVILLVLVGAYIPLHLKYKGNMYVVPDKSDVSNLSLILNNIIPADTSGLKKDKKSTVKKDSCKCCPDDNSAKILAIRYLFKRFQPVNTEDSVKTAKYLLKYSTAQLNFILKDFPLKTNSFFWLSGNCVFIEIIFWSILGLICSLLYSVSESLRNKDNSIDARELPVHWAKFVYSPVITLVIFLAADLLRNANELNVSKYGYDTLVLAFILGFASRRAIDLLDKLKSIILPGKETERAK